jgi:beta-mannosidase
LANVKAEAEYQVRLANSHPSLAVWASNNGIELGFELIARAVLPAAFGAVKTRYEKLFLDTLLHAVFDNTRSISYSPSSITNGYLSFNYSSPTPIIERCDNATAGTIFGNTDYYNYNVTKAINDSGYPIRRFATEFGFHSMPSLQSWEQVLPVSELHFNSSSTLSRNYHYDTNPADLLSPDLSNLTRSSHGGMGQMTNAAELYYSVPPKNPDSVANFSSWIYTTQVFQTDFLRN